MGLRFTPLPAAVVRVSGADAAAYLQGQCTADLRPGAPVHALWLNRKGRVLAHTFVVPEPDGSFLLVAERTDVALVLGTVTANVIADDVTAADESAAWTWGVMEGSAEPPLPVGAQAFPCAWLPGDDVRCCLGPAGAAFAGESGDFAVLERERIHAGIPVVPEDCGAGDFPQECGLGDWVCHDKGCYLGQEVMARIRSMGTLRRTLRLVSAPGGLVTGATLRDADGRSVGTIRSAFGAAALALVSAELPEGAKVFADAGVALLGPAASAAP